MGVIVGLLILSVMMIVHELGHFMTGRRLGFKVEEFSIFMGPVLFSWTRKGIKYNLKLFPLGASVRFAGEFSDDGTPDNEPGHFFNRPKWARAIVIVTGPVLNFVSGVLALVLMFSIFGYSVPVLASVQPDTLASAAGLAAGDRVTAINGHTVRTTLDYNGVDLFLDSKTAVDLQVVSPDGSRRSVTLEPQWLQRYRLGVTSNQVAGQPGIVVVSVEPDSNGGQPVLQVDDIILAVEGIPYEQTAQFKAAVESSAGAPITVTIIRGGVQQDVTMIATQYNDPVARGIYFRTQTTFLPAVGQSLLWPGSIVKLTLRSIGMMFAGTLKPQETLSGPIGVVTLISDVVGQEEPLADKIYQLLWLFALVSVSLGFMNLLPIPPLDGNHLVLIVVEAIRGRRLSLRTQNIIGFIGIGLIVVLAVAGLIFDVMRLINRV